MDICSKLSCYAYKEIFNILRLHEQDRRLMLIFKVACVRVKCDSSHSNVRSDTQRVSDHRSFWIINNEET